MDATTQLRRDLAYEQARGVHTYHACPCGRMRTRRGRCATCLRDDLAMLKKPAEMDPQPTGERMVWNVPSHTRAGKTYRVDATANNGAMFCACKDFATRRQPNIDKGLPPLVPKVKGERPDRGTICIHCTDLIFYFCRELFHDMAMGETAKPTNDL